MIDTVSSERIVLGTIIEANSDNGPLPLAIVQLLRNAPHSFGDPRHKQISSAIVDLQRDGKAVHPLAIQERLDFENSTSYLMDIIGNSMPMNIAESEAQSVWQAYIERKSTSIFAEAFEAVTANPEFAKSISKTARKALEDLSDESVSDGLPEIIDASALVSSKPVLPPEIIKGLLHLGSKLSLGGDSKAGKSWSFLDMAVSLASGSQWLGLETEQTRVLYVNLEIQPEFLHSRVETLCLARLIFPEPGWLDIWNLRGMSAPHDVLIPKIIKRAKSRGYGAIIIDPSYKLFSADADENSATDVNAVMRSFEQITKETKASVLFGAHFAKGNSASKEAIDRVSGSGVWARDPDCILTFTKHKEEDCFTVESILRNLSPLEKFVVKWIYPRFQRMDGYDPEDLKPARTGRPAKWKPEMALEVLGTRSLKSSDWQKLTRKEIGMPASSFWEIFAQIKLDSLAIKSSVSDEWRVSPTYRPPNSGNSDNSDNTPET